MDGAPVMTDSVVTVTTTIHIPMGKKEQGSGHCQQSSSLYSMGEVHRKWSESFSFPEGSPNKRAALLVRL